MGTVVAIVVAAGGIATGSWLWRYFRSVSRGEWRPADGAHAPWWSPGQGDTAATADKARPRFRTTAIGTPRIAFLRQGRDTVAVAL